MSNHHSYTWREMVDGVLVIGFEPRGADEKNPDATYDRDVAEFESRLEESDNLAQISFVVVDFENYEMTSDNGRAVVGLVVIAYKKLAAHGGGVCVCNHPVQFNPDLQDLFHMNKWIDIYRTREQALEATRSRIHEKREQTRQ